VFKNRGVTLAELLIVLIIVGILAALRFSDFGKLAEKNKGMEAEANLYMIYNAQKRYALDNAWVYYDCSPCDNSDMDKLGISLSGDNFNYEISSSIIPITAFTATAARSGASGLCAGQIMTITQDARMSKGCDRW
jgi:prepilin-type N-terminal cleavage/methylation domain-containing protein